MRRYRPGGEESGQGDGRPDWRQLAPPLFIGAAAAFLAMLPFGEAELFRRGAAALLGLLLGAALLRALGAPLASRGRAFASVSAGVTGAVAVIFVSRTLG